MKVENHFLNIIEKVQSKQKITRDECVYLLKFSKVSLEAAITRGVASRYHVA